MFSGQCFAILAMFEGRVSKAFQQRSKTKTFAFAKPITEKLSLLTDVIGLCRGHVETGHVCNL